MAVRCDEILNLPSLKGLKVVAGKAGLHRNLRWIYVAECFEDTREIVHWLHGGELVIITGLGLHGDFKALAELIEGINSKNVAGLVINVGRYIRSIPEEIIALADSLELPLFEMPWESKLVEVTRDICGTIIMKEMEEKSLNNLLENILFSDHDIEENLIDRAACYGYDLTGLNRVGILDIDGFASFLKIKGIKDEGFVIDIKSRFQKIVREVFLRKDKKPLTMMRSDSLIFLVESSGDDEKELRAVAGEINQIAQKRLYGLTVSCGIGNSYSSLKEMKKSYKEAEQALRAVKCENKKSAVQFYKELGIYSLLFSIRDLDTLRKFYNETFESLIQYDRLNASDLMNTLEVYLEESCNVASASERLYIHRNTLKYRIQKIEELLGCNLKDLRDCIKYGIGFKIQKIMGEDSGTDLRKDKS